MTTKPLFDRLFDRTAVLDNGCWEFTGGKDKNGYGKIMLHGKNLRTHRVAYDLCVGDIPDDIWVLHNCDNPSCVNPSHLFLGTAMDNNHDMLNKGREITVVGTDRWNSKFNEDMIREMRVLYANGMTQGAIANKFNTVRQTVQCIVNYKRWAHVR